jgi:hypothetical protein
VTEFEDGELPKDNLSYFDPSTNRILLLRHHHNDAVALHEAAHAIIWHRFGHKRIDHGKAWLGVYMWLMVEHQVAPQTALEASMSEHALEWDPIAESSPRNLGRKKGLAGV